MNVLSAYCGVDCFACPDYQNRSCPSCRLTEWSEDDICMPVKCCRKKGIASCGFCETFPCEDMRAFYEESDSHKEAYRRMNAENQLLNKCVSFHGHVCGGLAIGYKAALYAIELLELSVDNGSNSGTLSPDEEVVCIAENDACGCDAIQVILGCSVGKGNLLFHMRGKQAFSFYNRKTGRSVRLVMKSKPEGLTKEESLAYYQEQKPEALFDVKETTITLPEKAKMFDSYVCESCGEVTASNWIRIMNGKKVCLDCYEAYDRFNV